MTWDLQLSIEASSPPGLDPEKRRILAVIDQEVRRASMRHPPPEIPEYPQSVPDLDGHLEDMIEIATRMGLQAFPSDPNAVRSHVCIKCPHQFPHPYCTLRLAGGCILYQLAEPIVRAMADATSVHLQEPCSRRPPMV